jgi:carbon-monoxide dehydrogenase large subunit
MISDGAGRSTVEAGSPGLLGARLPRVEDDHLLRGAGRFLADVPSVGMLHAVFVRSPHPHARIAGISADAAGGLPGVHAVLSADDLPHAPLVDAVAIPGLARTPQPALARDRVRFVGEPVAIVLAETRALAEDAAELVAVDYRPLPTAVDPLAAGVGGPLLHEELGTNVVYRGEQSTPGLADAFAGATHVVAQRFRTGRLTAAPLEGRGAVAEFDQVSGRLTVRCSTQSPHLLQRKLALCLGIPHGQVRVLVDDVGGGFGQKIPASPEEIAVALAARTVARPVRWVEDRAENLLAGPQGKDQIVEAELAMDDDGRFLAMRCDVVSDAGAYSFNSASALIESYLSAGLLPGPYRIAETGWRVRAVLTNKAPVAPYRGVGWTASHSAREVLIDKAARLIGCAPSALRRRNLVSTADLPYRSAAGMVYDSGSFVASLDRVGDLLTESATRRGLGANGRYRGIGLSPYVEPSGWGSAGAAESAWSFASHDSVRVGMDASGGVTVAVGTPSQGQGHATTLAQLAAQVLGCAVSEVTVQADDTATVPLSTAGTRASRVATVTGGALTRAATTVRDTLAAVAAHLLECAPEEVELADGRAGVRGTSSPTSSLPLAEVATAALFDPGVRAGVPEPDLTATAFYDPPASYSNGCVGVVVEVDPGTGEVAVLDAAAVEDCGTAINPMIVEGQVLGAFAQGIGAALFEHVGHAADGTPTATGFSDYLLPTASTLPRVQLDHLHSPSPTTVNGVKGMGESAMIATPAAVACAVADALAGTGIEIDRTPIDPAYLVSQLAAQRPTPQPAPRPTPRPTQRPAQEGE